MGFGELRGRNREIDGLKRVNRSEGAHGIETGILFILPGTRERDILIVIMRVGGSFSFVSTPEPQMGSHAEDPCYSFFGLQMRTNSLEVAEGEFNADVNAIT